MVTPHIAMRISSRALEALRAVVVRSPGNAGIVRLGRRMACDVQLLESVCHARSRLSERHGMRDERELEELLQEWETKARKGVWLSAEELCQDCPELLDQVRWKIERLCGAFRGSSSVQPGRPSRANESSTAAEAPAGDELR